MRAHVVLVGWSKSVVCVKLCLVWLYSADPLRSCPLSSLQCVQPDPGLSEEIFFRKLLF